MTITIRAHDPAFIGQTGLHAVLYRSRETAAGAGLVKSQAPACFATQNALHGITGFLHHECGVFYQYLEGEAAALASLWRNLQEDPRHEAMTILHKGPIDARRFARQAMGWGDAEQRSLFDWLARSGLSLKGDREAQVVTAFMEYASAATVVAA